MTQSIGPRPTQTKVKHAILDHYLKAWGGIILQGLKWQAEKARRRGQPFALHFVYVDCFASTGRYSGELEEAIAGRADNPVFGSPIIGVKALDSLVVSAHNLGIDLRTNAILIEKEAAAFAQLQQTLDMVGLRVRARETDNFSTLRDGEIALVHANSTLVGRKLVQYTQAPGYTFSFFFLDPYGPTGIPLTFVGDIIRQPRHDVVINMPYQDLHKKTGLVTKQYDSLSLRKLIGHYDQMFGGVDWQNTVRRLETEVSWEEWEAYAAHLDVLGVDISKLKLAGDLELELVHLYRDSLRHVDPTLTVKSIPLHFPDKERTMFYLYLTTHDPTGALAMNKVLWDAGYEELELRQRVKDAKRPEKQLSMFESVDISVQKRTRPPIDELASLIVDKYRGKTVKRRDIYSDFAESEFFAPEIDRALTHLKRDGHAVFTGNLNNEREITIHGTQGS